MICGYKYKTCIYQRLIKQVKSLSIWSRGPNPVRIRQYGQTGNWGVTEKTIDPVVPQ